MARGRFRAAARHWMINRQRERNSDLITVWFPIVDELDDFLEDELSRLIYDPVYMTMLEYSEYITNEGGIEVV